MSHVWSWRSPAICLLCVAANSAFGQSAATKTLTTPPPDFIAYRALFGQVRAAAVASNVAVAKGKSDDASRNFFKSKAGLTDLEDGLLKQTAQSCSFDYDQHLKRGADIILKLKAQYKTRQALPPSAVDQINQLQLEREKIVTDCVAQLKFQLGPTGFAKVDLYTRQKVVQTVRKVDLNAPATAAQVTVTKTASGGGK